MMYFTKYSPQAKVTVGGNIRNTIRECVYIVMTV